MAVISYINRQRVCRVYENKVKISTFVKNPLLRLFFMNLNIYAGNELLNPESELSAFRNLIRLLIG